MAASKLSLLVCGATLMAGAYGCGDDGEPTPAPSAAGGERVPESSERTEEPESFEPVDSEEYWLLRALGMVRAEREVGDTLVVTIEDLSGEQRTVSVAREVLQDESTRNSVYVEAVHLLGRELGGDSEQRRSAARQRLEQLTKTTRAGSMGPGSPWLQWYREFGDFVRYNPELQRVEVDKTLAEAGRAASVRGLGLRLVGDGDRFKRSEPIKITVVLSRDEQAPPQWVNQRLRIPDDLSLELELEEDNRTTIVALLEPDAAGEPSRDDFVPLSPTETARTTIELTKLVEGDLAPGTYAVSATYRNEQSGHELDDSKANGVWIGEVSSARHRFRIVPW